jgi:dethiobiotin synthetase
MGRVVFVTGTDTGAGKTLLTASLLVCLRNRGSNALAMKPFSSGPRSDAKLFYQLQNRQLPLEVVNPFWFSQAVAPAIAAMQQGRAVEFSAVLDHIHRVRSICELLLVEGAGGLFVPLDRKHTVADLIVALDCPVLIAARNKLGVINHATLTVKALQNLGIHHPKVVLMAGPRNSPATRTNPACLRHVLAPVQVFSLPFLGKYACRPDAVRSRAPQLKRNLVRLLQSIP